MAAEQKSALKVVKKKWYPIFATPSFDEAHLGECLVASSSELVGRVVTANLMSLTNDIRQQHISLKFKVSSADSEKAVAELVSFEMAPSSIKRLVRRGVDRIDTSFVCMTGDGKRIRIKPFLLTKAYSKGLINRKLRKALVEFVASEVRKIPFDELVKSMIGNKLQSGVKSDLKKIYPIKSCEIKFAGIVSRGKAVQPGKEETIAAVPELEEAQESS